MKTTAHDTPDVGRETAMEQRIAAFRALPELEQVHAFRALAWKHSSKYFYERCGTPFNNDFSGSARTQLKRERAFIDETLPVVQRCFFESAQPILDRRVEDTALLMAVRPPLLSWAEEFDANAFPDDNPARDFGTNVIAMKRFHPRLESFAEQSQKELRGAAAYGPRL